MSKARKADRRRRAHERQAGRQRILLALGGAAAFAAGAFLFCSPSSGTAGGSASERGCAARRCGCGIEAPLTRVLAGTLFIGVGVVYVVFRGSSALGGLYADLGLTDLSHGVELEIARGAALPLVVALALVLLVIAWPLRRVVRR